MPFYRPSMAARLFVPRAGDLSARAQQSATDDVFELQVRPLRARLVSNNYREADELELTLLHDEAGMDPRFEGSAEVYFYLADSADDGTFTPGGQNQRFVGIVRNVDRDFDPSLGKIVRVTAHDYTTLFLEDKSFAPSGIPDFTQTLRSAWERVCDNTGYWDFSGGTPKKVSTVQALKPRLQLINVNESVTLGDAVPARIAKLGKLQVHGKADAWAVWVHAVESLGLITFIRGDRCIVTNASDFYTSDDPPRFIAGTNVTDLKEGRDLGSLSAKPVCVRSFDPLAGKTLEAFYPPPDTAPKKKKIAASANGQQVAVHAQDYELFDLPFAVASQAVLERIAERAWLERSREELRGRMRVVDMFVDTVNGLPFDVLKLQAGDAVNVEIDREALGMIQKLPTVGQRAAFLRDCGYSAQMTQYIVNNLDALVRVTPQFLVHSVETSIELPNGFGSDGTYETSIEFMNRIDVSGAATTNDVTGTKQPPMKSQTFDVTPSGAAEKTRNDRQRTSNGSG